jgi:hypothetical protein
MRILILILIAVPTLAFGQCPPGYFFNSSLQRCETLPICPVGFSLHPETDICFKVSINGKCSKGSVYNEAEKTCDTPTVCPPDTDYEMGIGKCLLKGAQR